MTVTKKSGSGRRLLEIDDVTTGDIPSPILDAQNCYVSYFEDKFGLQYIFCGLLNTTELNGGDGTFRAYLFVGDVGWDDKQELTWDKPCPSLGLNKGCQAWLASCWMAFTGNDSFRDVVERINRHASAILRSISEDGVLQDAATALVAQNN